MIKYNNYVNGQFLTPSSTQKRPTVNVKKGNYTLIMYDPDAPNGFVHWAANINDNVITDIIPYMGPSPPKGETHRYMFYLYPQKQIKLSRVGKIQKGTPIQTVFFTSKNTSAGTRRRRKRNTRLRYSLVTRFTAKSSFAS